MAFAHGAPRVIARFRRSCYVRAPSGALACVADPSIGRGPLNILVEPFIAPAEGSPLSLDLSGSAVWSAPACRADAFPGLAALQGVTSGRTAFARRDLARFARPALASLAAFLRDDAQAMPDAAAETLIGLGPGLTPSGDDFLGGTALGLRAAGRGGKLAQLAAWLRPRLARTSEISAAHLAAALEGEAHETVHDVLAGLTASRADWARLAARLAALGDTSGWDAAAGLTAGCAAALEPLAA